MRVVSLAPSNTEIIYEIDAEEHLVATTSLCDHPQKARKLSSVGGWINPDIDKIEELEPDIVIASDDLQNQAVEELENRNINVRQFKPHTLEKVFSSIEEIGKILGKEKKATELRADLEAKLSEIDLNETRIYCEEWMDPPMISGNWIPGLVSGARGEYMIDEGIRSRETGIKEIKKFNPEIIILNVCGAGKNIEIDEVVERDRWQEITAVRNQNIFVIDDCLLNRPGPRLIEGIKRIEKKIEMI